MVKEGYTREVIPVARHNDNIEMPAKETKYATKRTILTATAIPIAVSIPMIYTRLTDAYTSTTIPVTAPAPVITPAPPIIPMTEALAAIPPGSAEILATPTGVIADTSLEMLANVLDPLVQLMVTISFPIASVIMIGGMFFFLIGNTEKAWSTIFNAGLGYVLIQLSPLFLKILKQVGEAV